MIQVTNINDLKSAINQNGEMIITINNNNIVIMKIEEYMEKRKKEEIKKHLQKAEEDIENNRVMNAKEVFEEWQEKYGL